MEEVYIIEICSGFAFEFWTHSEKVFKVFDKAQYTKDVTIPECSTAIGWFGFLLDYPCENMYKYPVIVKGKTKVIFNG